MTYDRNYMRKWRQEHPNYMSEWLKKNPDYQSNYRKKIKMTVINHYTKNKPQCQCPGCAESQIEFLTLDHIAEDGSVHRRKNNISAGFPTHLWIYNNNFPCGFQVLCFNCNAAKSFHGHGTCPHVTMMKEMMAP